MSTNNHPRNDSLIYLPLDEALEDAKVNFVGSFFERIKQINAASEDTGEFETETKSTWGSCEEYKIVQAASRAVAARVRSYIEPNNTEYKIKGSENNDPSDTQYHIQIKVESIVEPSLTCPLSVDFQASVETRDPEGDGLHDFYYGSLVRRDKEGKWIVDEEENSTEDEEETGEEQEEEDIGAGWSQASAPSSFG
jgi:hypothetical protein